MENPLSPLIANYLPGTKEIFSQDTSKVGGMIDPKEVKNDGMSLDVSAKLLELITDIKKQPLKDW